MSRIYSLLQLEILKSDLRLEDGLLSSENVDHLKLQELCRNVARVVGVPDDCRFCCSGQGLFVSNGRLPFALELLPDTRLKMPILQTPQIVLLRASMVACVSLVAVRPTHEVCMSHHHQNHILSGKPDCAIFDFSRRTVSEEAVKVLTHSLSGGTKTTL